jgi:deazaflavin-dependent oxidoreductase (nitroreductase family)
MPMNRSWMKFASGLHEFWYSITGGVVGARMNGVPVLLLSTTGRKSGRQRTAPLTYLADGDRYVVVASNGGAPKHPSWFLNLRDQPEARVQVGRERMSVRAEVASDEERARLWPKLVERYSSYDDYQQETSRKIPVVILRPQA